MEHTYLKMGKPSNFKNRKTKWQSQALKKNKDAKGFKLNETENKNKCSNNGAGGMYSQMAKKDKIMNTPNYL